MVDLGVGEFAGVVGPTGDRVPNEIRAWAVERHAGRRSSVRGVEAVGPIVVAWVLAIVVGERVGGFGGWALAWAILLFVGVRLQITSHEAAHRGVFGSRLANDTVSLFTGVALLHSARCTGRFISRTTPTHGYRGRTRRRSMRRCRIGGCISGL